MKKIQILGSGCANCATVYRMIEEAARDMKVEVELEKVEDMAEIMRHGVMSTPGVIVDGTLVHAGGLPERAAVEGWLAGGTEAPCCSGDSGSGGCCG